MLRPESVPSSSDVPPRSSAQPRSASLDSYRLFVEAPTDELDRRELHERAFKAVLAKLLAHDGLEPSSVLHLLGQAQAIFEKWDDDSEQIEIAKQFLRARGANLEAYTPAKQVTLRFLVEALRDPEVSKRPDVQSVLYARLQEDVQEQVIPQLEEIEQGIIASARDSEGFERGVRRYLDRVFRLTNGLSPADPKHKRLFEVIYERFLRIPKLKQVVDKESRMIIENLLREHADDIDAAIFPVALQRETAAGKQLMVERVFHETLVRSQEEVEELKRYNREQSVYFLSEQLERGSEITIDFVERLHRVASRGFMSAEISKQRGGTDIMMTFGNRLGVLPDYVEEQLNELFDRANDLLWQSQLRPMSRIQFDLAVARIHNDFLEIHPFSDRNGSTAVLLVEYLQMHRGYIPKAEREPNYYTHITRAFSGDILAVAMVAMEHKQIATPGFYHRITEMGGEALTKHEKVLSVWQRHKNRLKKT